MGAKVIRLLRGRVAVVFGARLIAHGRAVWPVTVLPGGLRLSRVLLRPLRERAMPLRRRLLRRLSCRVRARSLRRVRCWLLRLGRRLSGSSRTAVSSLLGRAVRPVPTSSPPTRCKPPAAVSSSRSTSAPARHTGNTSPAQTGRRARGPRVSYSASEPTPHPPACAPLPFCVDFPGATTRGWLCRTLSS